LATQVREEIWRIRNHDDVDSARGITLCEQLLLVDSDVDLVLVDTDRRSFVVVITSAAWCGKKDVASFLSK